MVWQLQYRTASADMEYTPLTNFADSATSPALSPDGRMLAFIRSEYTFGGPGQIYVKRLPDGEPVQLTHDNLDKRGSPKFSPDGTLIAYAAHKPGSAWDTGSYPYEAGSRASFCLMPPGSPGSKHDRVSPTSYFPSSPAESPRWLSFPQQITSGVTQEEGIELAPDGRSFVTSIGASQSTVWFHDSHGDRQITSEGYALLPSVSPDGKKLYYLLRAGGERHFVSGELWVADLESGRRQRLVPDFLMQHYAISTDGQRVVFVASDDTGRSPLWIAPLDGRFARRQLLAEGAWKAYFVAGGYVIFVGDQQGQRFVYRLKEDGSELQRVVRYDSASSMFSASPDGKWVVIPDSTDRMQWPAIIYPVGDGSPTVICRSCVPSNDVERTASSGVSWSPDGKFIYLKFQESMYAVPLHSGQRLPPIPASGFESKEEIAALPGARLIPEQGAFPGPDPSIYAFTKVATHRNIYRVTVR